MLKKYLTFLMVLILMVPALGFACGCNPIHQVNPGPMSSDLSTSGTPCDCCQALEVNRARCEIGHAANANAVSSVIQVLPLPLAAGSVQTNHPLIFDAYSKFDPPEIFSELPLYLALRVLRL